MNLLEISASVRLLLGLITLILIAGTVRSQDYEDQTSVVKVSVPDDKATLESRTKFIFYDKK